MHLEPLEGGLGLRPEQSVQRTGFVPQAPQQALYLENTLRAPRTPVAGTWANGIRTGRGPTRLAVVGTQRRPGLGAGDAACRKAMGLLETPNRAFCQRAVEAIDRTRVVRLVAEGALEVAHAC
jgi:hypothetical protein